MAHLYLFYRMKPLLFIITALISAQAFCQSADFILLKKHNRTIGSYYKGNDIAFTNPQGSYIEALITDIKNDTLFLRQFIIRQVPTTLSVYMLDTVASYRYQYNYKEIKAIGRAGGKFNVSGSAAALMGGGALLTVASGVVYLADRNKFSPQLMVGAMALGGIGYLMAKLTGKGMVIGKKYSLVYVEVSNNKKP
ncbi:hypothetical protein BH11BAC5_BH11BAC5_27030 [soil metagenome]